MNKNVLHRKYEVNVVGKRLLQKDLVLSLVSTLFHMNIYSQMLPSYKGDFSTRICKIKVLSLMIIKVQSKQKLNLKKMG